MYEDKEGGVVCGMLDAGRWCTSIPELLFGCDLGGAQQQLKHRDFGWSQRVPLIAAVDRLIQTDRHRGVGCYYCSTV